MTVRIKNVDGELELSSVAELKQAFSSGLVAPDDLVSTPDSPEWRRAGSIPELATLPRHRDPWFKRPAAWYGLAATLAGTAAVSFVIWGLGWVLYLVVIAVSTAYIGWISHLRGARHPAATHVPFRKW